MSLTIQQTEALYKLYSQITNTIGDVAYDADGNKVVYDINLINSKVTEAEQTQATAKASALAKLTALGLTEDEVKSLIG
jgi:hypothetical protein